MNAQQYVAIVECSSNGRFYIPEARSRGLQPLVIYPKLPDSPYTAMRRHTRDFLDEDIPVIDAPDNMDDLLRLLEPYSIVCVLAGSEYGVAMADELANCLGLPGNSPETSFMKLQKSAMQEALKQAGILYIRSSENKIRRKSGQRTAAMGSTDQTNKYHLSSGEWPGGHSCFNPYL